MKAFIYSLLLCPLIGYTQITINGVVKDKKTETLIENAIVVLKPFRIKGGGYYSGKKTQKNGLFKLSTNYNYPMQLITTKKGCETKKIKIKKGSTYVEVVIECDEKAIKEIIKEQTSDVDNDGILDRDDQCIEVAGDPENNGCPWPDDDKDGVRNEEDDCIDQAGPKTNNGCPLTDQDEDGIPDNKDDCPQKAGTQATNGCPIVPTKFIEFVENEKNNILFNSGSSLLDSDDTFILKSVKTLLNFYKNVSITIEGYASTDGSKTDNQQLSEQRAKAIKNHLVSKGIAHERLSVIGYGESRPIGNNNTKEGRTKNRRAQIILNQ